MYKHNECFRIPLSYTNLLYRSWFALLPSLYLESFSCTVLQKRVLTSPWESLETFWNMISGTTNDSLMRLHCAYTVPKNPCSADFKSVFFLESLWNVGDTFEIRLIPRSSLILACHNAANEGSKKGYAQTLCLFPFQYLYTNLFSAVSTWKHFMAKTHLSFWPPEENVLEDCGAMNYLIIENIGL